MSLFVKADDGSYVDVEKALMLKVTEGQTYKVRAFWASSAHSEYPTLLGEFDLPEQAEQFLNQLAARLNGTYDPTMTAAVRRGMRFGDPEVNRG